MASEIEQRLEAMGVVLPQPAAPAANYLPFMQAGDLLFTAGQLPMHEGKLFATGLLGRDLDVSAGQQAARLCAVNVLAQARAAVGSLEHLAGLVKITVFVASAADFNDQHLVANGASDLFAEAMGSSGRHARSAVGCASLPLGAPVEVEAIFRLAKAGA